MRKVSTKEGSRAIIVAEDDGEAPLAKVLVEASHRGSLKMSTNPSHQSVVGGMSLWFTEDVYEDPPAKVFGRGNVGVDAKGVEEAPRANVLMEVVSVCRRCWRRQCWCRRRRCQRSSFC